MNMQRNAMKDKDTRSKKVCRNGHTFYKSSDCPSCPICEKEKTPAGVFANMASPVRSALELAGIKTLRQLSKKTEKEVLGMHGIGPSSMPKFKKKLKEEGLSFKQEEKADSMNQSRELRSGPPRKMKSYESFSAWEKEESKTNKLTKVVSRHIQAAAPHLDTTVKWGQGCFLKKGKPVIYIHTEPDHVQLGFYNGSALKDPDRQLEGKGKYVRHVKIVTGKDIPSKGTDYFIKQVS